MTNRDLNAAERDQLEALVDVTGLNSVLMALSEICAAKSDHIAESWQDKALAKQWAGAAGAIGITVCDRYVFAVSH